MRTPSALLNLSRLSVCPLAAPSQLRAPFRALTLATGNAAPTPPGMPSLGHEAARTNPGTGVPGSSSLASGEGIDPPTSLPIDNPLRPRTVAFRPVSAPPKPDRIPAFHHNITDVATFLSALKRPSMVEQASKFTSWEDLFSKDGVGMKGTGMQPKDRRYLLRCMERYRAGENPSQFATGLRPKRLVRGWGPRLQGDLRKKTQHYP